MTSSELTLLPSNIVSRTTVLNDGEAEQKRSEILYYFHKSFDLYESLLDCLASEEAYTTGYWHALELASGCGSPGNQGILQLEV